MGSAGKNRLLALCVGTILVFFAQSMFSFSEHAGLVRCVADFEHQSAAGSEEPSDADCCHIDSSGLGAKVIGVPIAGLFGMISVRDATAPDGPVRDIDYPPQLS